VVRISEIMDLRCIKLELAARNKEEAVRELVRILADAGKVEAEERCVAEVMAREGIASTGIGQGIAIPHRLIEGAGEIVLAVGRSEFGVPFNSIDGKPAHLVFLIIGPQGRNNEYLKTLSSLSRLLNERKMFVALMRARTADEVMELIREREN